MTHQMFNWYWCSCHSREEGVESNCHPMPCMHPGYILLEGCGVNVNYTWLVHQRTPVYDYLVNFSLDASFGS